MGADSRVHGKTTGGGFGGGGSGPEKWGKRDLVVVNKKGWSAEM